MSAEADQNEWMTNVDEEILEELKNGARTKGYLVDVTGRHRNTIGQHLKNLVLDDMIECLHQPTALYQLKDSSGEEEK